jgi:hypothetical protein
VWVQGISPDGTHVVYHDVFEGVDHQLKLQATDSLTPLAISPVISCTLCTINFGGWSYDGRQIAYAFVWIETPHSSSCDLYVANVARRSCLSLLNRRRGPTGFRAPPGWRYGDNGYTLQLFNHARARVPCRSFEDTRLFVEEWRYVL